VLNPGQARLRPADHGLTTREAIGVNDHQNVARSQEAYGVGDTTALLFLWRFAPEDERKKECPLLLVTLGAVPRVTTLATRRHPGRRYFSLGFWVPSSFEPPRSEPAV
jgi:hypothetical protein